MEQLGLPKLDIQHGGGATLDELFDESMEIRDKINEIVVWINLQEEPPKMTPLGSKLV